MAGSPFKLGHDLEYWLFMAIGAGIIIFSILWEYALQALERVAHTSRYVKITSERTHVVWQGSRRDPAEGHQRVRYSGSLLPKLS